MNANATSPPVPEPSVSVAPGLSPGDAGATRPAERAAVAPRGRAWAVRLTGVTAVLLGGGYFIAWMSGAAARWSASGVITMKTNMSVALVLAGGSLLLSETRQGMAGSVVRAVASAFVLAIGLSTLSEHIFGVDLGIDQLLAIEAPGAAATTSPNRFGVPGSVSLSLLGAGLVSLCARRRAAPYLGLATLMITSIPAVGFLYRVGLLFSTRTTGIAWPTVVALSAVALGLMLSKPVDGPVPLLWRDDAGGRLLRQLWVPVTLVPVVIGALRAEGERRGLYDGSIGDGAATILLIVFFSALFWRSAAKLSMASLLKGRADDRLRQALAHARSLGRFPQENPDPILRLSSDLTVVYANDAALSRLGSLGLAVGRPVPAPIGSVAEDAVRAARRRELEIVCDGAVFNMAVVPVGNELNLYAHDITARRTAEDAIRQADQRKREFISALSHELRNPLAPIRNSTHILQRVDPASEQARRARAVIDRQTEHLTRLVDDLLDVTRIERGRFELQRSLIDLREVVSQAVEDFRPAIEERGLAFSAELPVNSIWCEADATRITQIIGNLLHNAAKFTAHGGHVALSLRCEARHAEIRVRDTGVGIDPALLPYLFDPFVQGDRSLARTKGGLGLGLALVKGIAELHGGVVWAESASKGHGAEFIVRLPLAATGE